MPGSVISGIEDAGRLLPDVGRDDRPGGLEVRVRPLDLEVFVEDPQQAPEMGVAPFTAGPLALLDDRVDRTPRRLEVGHRDELRPAEMLLGRLGVRRPDEQAVRAQALGQVLEADLDRPVELADRVELLQLRDDLVPDVVRQRDGLRDRLEPLGVLDVHAFGSFEEGEVSERCLAEGQQLDPDAGRIAVGRHREVRAGEAGRGADARQEVLGEGQVEHLLLADLQQGLPPALDRCERLGGQSLADVLLERERREEVLEHDQVLELGRLPERIDQRLPVLEPRPRSVTPPPADGEDVGQRSVRAGLTISIMSILRGSVGCGIVGIEAVVRVAPPPVLVWFGGPDHRMARLLEMSRGVPVRAQVAAAGPSARQALAEVLPAGADLHARGTDVERGVERTVGLEMLADSRHVAASTQRARSGTRPVARSQAMRTLAPNRVKPMAA